MTVQYRSIMQVEITHKKSCMHCVLQHLVLCSHSQDALDRSQNHMFRFHT